MASNCGTRPLLLLSLTLLFPSNLLLLCRSALGRPLPLCSPLDRRPASAPVTKSNTIAQIKVVLHFLLPILLNTSLQVPDMTTVAPHHMFPNWSLAPNWWLPGSSIVRLSSPAAGGSPARHTYNVLIWTGERRPGLLFRHLLHQPPPNP